MQNYSQNGEQSAILQALGFPTIIGDPADMVDVHPGRFLEIGAFHPKQNSNTRALYELGWSGVMVEPSPGGMNSLLEAYGQERRIVLIQAAVGLAPRLAPFQITDDALSSSDEAHIERCVKAGYAFKGEVLIPQLTLERLFMEVGNAFDFVSIDVEGGSADLALQYFAMVREHPQSFREAAPPHAIIVEHDHRVPELTAAGAAKGYRVALKNGENLLLVRG
jgi:FkbM family methyltransferase